MQLKYHQPTYDLLTQSRIDPQKAIRDYDARNTLEDVVTWAEIRHENLDERKQRYKYYRSKALSWTRLNLFQRPAAISEENVRKLDAFERDHHMQFPASVREWYSLDIAPDVMSANDLNLLEHLDIPEFQIPSVIDSLSTSDPRDDLWCFLFGEISNQGGDHVYFQTGKSDDPPVLARLNRTFIEIAPTFSEFLFVYYWDWFGRYHFEHKLLTTDKTGIGPLPLPERYHVPLDRLGQFYKRLSNSTEPRFYDAHTRIWVRYPFNMTPAERQKSTLMSIGVIHADSLTAARSAVEKLWPDDAPLFYLDSMRDDAVNAMVSTMQLARIHKILDDAPGWISGPELYAAVVGHDTDRNFALRHHLIRMLSRGEIETDPPSGDTPLADRRFRLTR